jgi:hypothetical protein
MFSARKIWEAVRRRYLFYRLRSFRGRLPADFRFNREEANRR